MNEESPLVSVVLPTYGRPDLIDEAVRSVLDQTYDRLELIVVDDCSPDPVEPALADVETGEKRLRVVRHEENRGANAARSTGIEAADGEFVAFVDDDDVWLPEKVARQVAAFDDPAVGVVSTGLRYEVDGDPSFVLEASLTGDATVPLLTGEPFGTFSTLMVRASVVEAAGLPDERFPCWQDREWPVRLSRHCRFGAVPEVQVVHRMGDHDQLTDDFETKRDVAYPLFVETFRPLAAEYGPDVERRMVASRAKQVATSALKAGRYDDARRFALRTVRTTPTDLDAYLTLALALGGRPVFSAAQRARRAVVRRSSSRAA